MKAIGEYAGASRNIDGDLVISFAIDEDSSTLEALEKIKDKELVIEVKKHSQRHSDNQRKYFHDLNDELARKLRISRFRCKNLLIFRYGQVRKLPNGDDVIIKTNIPSEMALEDANNHMMPVKFEDNATFYKLFKGTGELTTEEYCRLIDGTIEECREQGIETDTPAEIMRLKELWNERHK